MEKSAHSACFETGNRALLSENSHYGAQVGRVGHSRDGDSENFRHVRDAAPEVFGICLVCAHLGGKAVICRNFLDLCKPRLIVVGLVVYLRKGVEYAVYRLRVEAIGIFGSERVVKEMHAAGKPIVALCIAPVLIARILGDVSVTIGNDPETSMAIKAMGATAEICSAAQVCIDKKNKIITTPCYMLDKSLKEVAQSTSNAVRDLMEMLK